MTLSDTELITFARQLWPDLTEDAASDAFLLAWLPQQRRHVSEAAFGEEYDIAVAHLLAHAAYRLNPGKKLGTPGAAFSGSVTAKRSGKVGANFSDASAGVRFTDKNLATTAPGMMFMEIRDNLSAGLPFMVSW